jgi:hypothetical protein
MITARRQSSPAGLGAVESRRAVPRNQVFERAGRQHDRRAQQARRVEVLGPVHPARRPPVPTAPRNILDHRTRLLIQARVYQNRIRVLQLEFAAAHNTHQRLRQQGLTAERGFQRLKHQLRLLNLSITGHKTVFEVLLNIWTPKLVVLTHHHLTPPDRLAQPGTVPKASGTPGSSTWRRPLGAEVYLLPN